MNGPTGDFEDVVGAWEFTDMTAPAFGVVSESKAEQMVPLETAVNVACGLLLDSRYGYALDDLLTQVSVRMGCVAVSARRI